MPEGEYVREAYAALPKAMMARAARPCILIVEDDARYVRLLHAILQQHDYRTQSAGTGARGLELIASEAPDAVVLDLWLPDLDGLEVLERMRQFSDAPVIIVSARDDEADIVRGLEAGADDYLGKPFGVPELLARLRAVMRRTPQAQVQIASPFESGDLRIDFAAAEVSVAGKPVRLSATEYRLLQFLARNAGRVLVPDQLLENVWGPEYVGDEHLVRVYVSRVRQKIERDRRNPRHLITRPGVGYMLRRHESPHAQSSD